MATKTTNYNLTKPSAEDFYNIDDHNGNMDIIDEELYKHSSDGTKHNRATEKGGALGNDSVATSGGAVGCKAETHAGGAVGYLAASNSGGSMGYMADVQNGGAIGEEAMANNGGAMGYKAKTTHGCAIGHQAVTAKEDGTLIDAVQLGSGTNTLEKTMQVYNYRLMNANGKIPSERLPVASGSYVGTGTYGKNNPNSITFDFEPKLVILQGDATVIMIRGTSKATYYTTTSYSLTLTWSGNVLSWYNVESAGRQFNTSGDTYHWVAIG